ncbi:MAG: endonuclease/exonuclease/phosphatase family protein [Flavobacteriales bacterium]
MRIIAFILQLLLTLAMLGSCAASVTSLDMFPIIQILPAFDLVWFVASIGLVMMGRLVFMNQQYNSMLVLLATLTLTWHKSSSQQAIENSSRANRIKILSLNVSQLGNDTGIVNQTIELIKEIKPDVVCLQEFGLYYKWPNVDAVSRDFSDRIGLSNYHFSPHRGNIFGVATFSRYPIDSTHLIYNMLSFTNEGWLHDLNVNGQQLRLINLHLQSFNLNGSMQYDKRLTPIQVIDMQWEQIAALLAKDQAQEPTIIIGDFNAALGSIHLNQFKKHGYINVAASTGNGLIPTLNWIPLAIDHVEVSQNVHCASYCLDDRFPSDHKAVVMNISF